jgi:hypothetical protein
MSTDAPGTLLPFTPPRRRSSSFYSPYRTIAPSLKALEDHAADIQTRLDDQLGDIACFEDTARRAQDSLAKTIALADEHARLLMEQIAALRQAQATPAPADEVPTPPVADNAATPLPPVSAIDDLRRRIDELTCTHRHVSIAPDDGVIDGLARARHTTVEPTGSVARSTTGTTGRPYTAAASTVAPASPSSTRITTESS